MVRSSSRHISTLSDNASDLAMQESAIDVLPFRLGRVVIAVEAGAVSTLGGPECELLLKSKLPENITFINLATAIHESSKASEYIVAKILDTEAKILFAVDEILRLARVNLEHIRPLPAVTLENISVPFFFGVTAVQQEIIYLLDPVALLEWNRSAE